MENVNLTIDGVKMSVPSSYTILEAARANGIEIPTLCHLKDINEIGACRMCIVEVEGARGFVTSCVGKVSEGMVVRTNTKAIREARKTTLELLLSAHDKKCLTCVRNKKCELQTLSEKLHIDGIEFEGEMERHPIDNLCPSIVRDPNKCILCKRCVSMCKKVQEVGAIDTMNRGFKSVVGTAFNKFVWPMYQCLSDGSFVGERRNERCLESIRRPGKICCCANGACCKSSDWRRIWNADWNACYWQDGCWIKEIGI